MSASSVISTSVRSDNANRFYERLLAEALTASSAAWPVNGAFHNFGFSFGEGANFRKHFFNIEAANIERFVQLAIECGIGDEVLDRYTTSQVEADAFPSRTRDKIGWLMREGDVPSFPAQVTLREFLLARNYDVPLAYRVSDEFTQELYRRGVLIPQAVAELELSRVNFNRKQETEPYILEENCSQIVGRGYGHKPRNAAGQPCNELTESKKRKLYATRFMHRFPLGASGALYIPASPERVMSMLAAIEELLVDGMDVSFLLHPNCKSNGSSQLQRFLQYTSTDATAASRFPCQDVHCLKWQAREIATPNSGNNSVSLGQWLERHGYLKAEWQNDPSGSLVAIRQ